MSGHFLLCLTLSASACTSDTQNTQPTETLTTPDCAEGRHFEDGACVLNDAEANANATWDGSDPLCLNTCMWANDDTCDDGGDGPAWHLCAYGTDCSDCGPRAICEDTCLYSADAECDDGFTPALDGEAGESADTNLCTAGSDCSDCGSRY
jgi:hypothetical protein